MSDRQLKLCVVNPFEHGGGAEYQISLLLDTLAVSGKFDSYYLAHHVEAADRSRSYQAIQIGRRGHVPSFGYAMDAVPLYKALQAIRPDVIYQRVAGGYTGVCAHYSRLNRVRMVWHVAHDSDVGRDNSFYGRNPVRRFLERRSIQYGIRHASHIVTQTRDQAKLLEANYSRVPDMVLPNFHPLPEVTWTKSEPIKVLWIANLKPIKRPDAFVRLTRALQDLPNVQFVMIGEPAGSEAQEWGIALMRDIRAAKNLTYLGKLSQVEVNRQLEQAHMFLNTSVQEGFPNTFIQAWMRQVPVVSLSVNPDGVLDLERVGLYAGSEPALADAVRSLVTDVAQLGEYAQRAREYAARQHSLQNAFALARLLETGQVAHEYAPVATAPALAE